mgnify:FL=1
MSLLAAITWDDDANFTITLFINSYYRCMFVQLEDSILNISNMLIAPHFHLLMALCLYHKMYCFLIIKHAIREKYRKQRGFGALKRQIC